MPNIKFFHASTPSQHILFTAHIETDRKWLVWWWWIMNIMKSSLQVPSEPRVAYKVSVCLEYYFTNVSIKSTTNAMLSILSWNNTSYSARALHAQDLLWRLYRPGCTAWHKGITRGKTAMGSARHSYYHLNLLPRLRILPRIFAIRIFMFCFNQKAHGAMSFPVPFLA